MRCTVFDLVCVYFIPHDIAKNIRKLNAMFLYKINKNPKKVTCDFLWIFFLLLIDN